MELVEVIDGHQRNDGSDAPSVASSSYLSSSSESPNLGPSVAVIGCGPGGMSFLHALACRRKKLKDSGDLEAIKHLPVVTCFERNSVPGGVWRSADESKPKFQSCNSDIKLSKSNSNIGNKSSTNMYEGLWINGCKEALEYSDYTFDDHFGCAMPVFLPRADVLEYMLARVTQHEDIFQQVLFNTTVLSVVYNDVEKEFVIKSRDESGAVVRQTFDKCIYSGGMNGSPKYANDILAMLQKQHFTGQAVHSAQMNSLEANVKGKRIIMVGDSYSAEDLSLQCIKLGATKIFITSRTNCGTASSVKSWPGNKVEFLWYQLPFAVQNGNTILCRSGKDDNDVTSVPDVDIVIFCTGYRPNFDMLSPDLLPWDPDYNEVSTISVPKDWSMKDNTLTKIVGEVPPPTEVNERSRFICPKLYRRMLIKNTNMMYLFESNDYPLMDIDTGSWLCLAHICGETEILSPKEMRRRNHQEILEEMQTQWRYYIDDNYRAACKKIPKDHWYYNNCSEMYKEYLREWGRYQIKVTARAQKDGGYPVQFESDQIPTDIGRKYLELYVSDCMSKYQLKTSDEDAELRTFRDCDPSNFASIHTGTEAVPFKAMWMELDDKGEINM